MAVLMGCKTVTNAAAVIFLKKRQFPKAEKEKLIRRKKNEKLILL
jgi:hypothetical protein